MLPLVSVTICFLDNHLKYFKKLMNSLENQTVKTIEIIIVDKTKSTVVSEFNPIRGSFLNFYIIKDSVPSGFAYNYNNAIKKSRGNFVFVLNPDTFLAPNCIEEILTIFEKDDKIGCVSPKILRMNENLLSYNPPIIDSTGLYLTPFIRHFDRGADEIDFGQYNEISYIFGVTGAAQFFKKSCLEDIKILDQYFDEDFWSYREDADISWRLWNYGWKCAYTSTAIMYHARTAKPNSRKKINQLINMHSVKNRYLLLINNISIKNFLIYLPFILYRDLLIIVKVFLFERTSIEAFLYIKKNLRYLLKKRKIIHSKITKDMSSYWFLHKSIKLKC